MNEENIVLCGAAVEQALIYSTLSSIFSFTFINRTNRTNCSSVLPMYKRS
ncbi:hypothetical protein [Bacillus cereus]|nr:hypothetical protein [Bacillus cereus]